MDFSRPHKPPRLPGYDYTTPGYYFVTFNTRVRNQNILCEIKPVGTAALGGPDVSLTRAGTVIRELIENIPHVYPDVNVDCYAIMPDHVHLILVLGCGDGPPRAAAPTSLSKVVNSLKSLATKHYGQSLWQDEYYDHVIRNDTDLDETRKYIRNNPHKWTFDKEVSP